MIEEKNPIQVADRLFLVLETLAENGSAGLMELSNLLALHKSTVHRLLNSLIYMEYAKQDPDTGKYSLTFKLTELSNKVLNKVDIIETIRPYLKRLVQKTGETVHFVQLDGNEAVYIDKVESHQNSVRMVSKVGSHIPLYCSGVGKALAASMPDAEVERIWNYSNICQLTPHTIIDFQEYLKVLNLVRSTGYAMDDEENEIGVRCIAASLHPRGGMAHYAFSISAPVNRMTDERIQELAQEVLAIKKEMMKEII